MPSERILLCTVGLPYSGKSTWAQGLPLPIVCPDAIRWAVYGQRYWQEGEPLVWATAKVMVRALFYAGHRVVILDATNTTRKRRDEWHDEGWETRFKVLDVPALECVARAEADDDFDIIPVIRRMADAWEPLEDDEEEW